MRREGGRERERDGEGEREGGREGGWVRERERLIAYNLDCQLY